MVLYFLQRSSGSRPLSNIRTFSQVCKTLTCALAYLARLLFVVILHRYVILYPMIYGTRYFPKDVLFWQCTNPCYKCICLHSTHKYVFYSLKPKSNTYLTLQKIVFEEFFMLK